MMTWWLNVTKINVFLEQGLKIESNSQMTAFMANIPLNSPSVRLSSLIKELLPVAVMTTSIVTRILKCWVSITFMNK